MTLTGLVVVCQLVTGPGYHYVRFLACRRFRNDGIAFKAAALQNQIARRSDEMQLGCRERRGLQPILDDSLVLVGKRTVVVHKRVLNSPKAREDANHINAEGVAEDFLSNQLIDPPLRRFQILSRWGELRPFFPVPPPTPRPPASVIRTRATSIVLLPAATRSDV